MELNNALVRIDNADTAILGESLADSEKALLSALLSDDTLSVDIIIPKDVDQSTLEQALSVCSKVHGKMIKANMRLKPIIGRLLTVIQENPSIHEAMGYKSFDRFVTEKVPELTGMVRAEAYGCKRIVETFPSITIKDFNDIGYVNLLTLSGITSDGAPSRDKWFDAARNSTIEQLKAKAAEDGLIDPNDTEVAKISIVTSKTIASLWKQFSRDKKVQAFVGSKDPGHILEALISECYIEWLNRSNDVV